MIQHLDAEDPAGVEKPPGNGNIVIRRFRVTTGMAV
jgi:hypothetical protein